MTVRSFRGTSAFLIACLALSASGCLERDLRPLNPCVRQGFIQEVQQNAIDKVDIVFMIDNSGSMSEEQASVRVQLPRLVNVLTSGDPTPSMPNSGDEFSAVKDLHIGIVSSDMGSAGFNVRTCESMLGDDGLFSTPVANQAGRRPDPTTLMPPLTNCPALPTTPSFLAFTAGQDAARFANDFSCLANLGTKGCGFEQQLEAPLKALWPPPGVNGDPPDGFGATGAFALGTQGHGQNEHNGFLRTDSVLAIVVVSDEEDCSVRDTNIFDEQNPAFMGVDLNLRCGGAAVGGFGAETAWPIRRFVEGFRALRADRPSLLVFAAVVGVPPDSRFVVRNTMNPTGGEGLANLNGILDEPLMQEAVFTADPSWTCTVDADCVVNGSNLRCTAGQCVPRTPALRPSCNIPGRGIATPPRRIVEVARDLAMDGQVATIVQSICQADYTPAFDGIIKKIADALGNVCLPRPLNTDATGLVDCKVVETLPAGQRCADFVANGASAMPLRTVSGREVCAINQIALVGGMIPAGREGWYYDNFSMETMMKCSRGTNGAQRIVFTPNGLPAAGATVGLECLQNVLSVAGGQGAASVGTDCTAGDPTNGDTKCATGNVVVEPGMPGTALICEVNTGVCQLPCSDDSGCPSGYRCATNEADINVGPETAQLMRGFCVNPTCN